jgi:hypothetical protein
MAVSREITIEPQDTLSECEHGAQEERRDEKTTGTLLGNAVDRCSVSRPCRDGRGEAGEPAPESVLLRRVSIRQGWAFRAARPAQS